VTHDQDYSALLRSLGDNLRALREAAGKSQDALANDSGLHRTYVGAVERGERNPTYITLVKYAGGLGLSVADLVRGLR
jgi:transcriptional regulator with XRE-family HTH domain